MTDIGKRPMVAIVNGLINPIPPVKGGGPQIVIWNTCRELNDAPFDWRVLSLWDEQVDQCEFDREKYIQVKPTALERKFVGFTRVLPYRLVKWFFGVHRPDHLLLNLAMVRNLKNLDPDLIFVHESYSLTYMCHQWFPRKKILFYYHSCKMHMDLTRKRWERLVRSASGGMIAICARSFDLVEKVYQSTPSQNWVILNGVNPFKTNDAALQKTKKWLKMNKQPDEFLFLYIGRIHELKGLDILLDSFSDLIQRSSLPTRLLIIGSAGADEDGNIDFEKSLIARAKEIAPDQIDFVGFVPNDQLAEYYQISDCGVLPTRLLEGNSLFLMECLSMGVPVIATSIGGVPEVVRDGLDGILIDEENLATHLGSAMLAMIEEREQWNNRRIEIAAAARERFSYKRVAKEFIQVVESVLFDHEK